jgi:hypothetical protein
MGEYEIAGHFLAGENARFTAPVTAMDGYGELTAVEIHDDSTHEVLTGEPLERLKHLARNVAKRAEARPIASYAYVQKHLLGWLERTRFGATTASWCDELQAALAEDVQAFRVFVPCDGLEIARPFRLGNVEFRYFSRADIVRMTEPHDPSNVDHVRRRQRMLDGYLAT